MNRSMQREAAVICFFIIMCTYESGLKYSLCGEIKEFEKTFKKVKKGVDRRLMM